MTSTYKITLDLHVMASPIALDVKRGETGRVLEITLAEDGAPVLIPDGAVIAISDNEHIDAADVDPSRFEITSERIRYTIAPAYLSTVGPRTLELRVVSSNQKVYAATVTLNVYDALDAADDTAVEEAETAGLIGLDGLLDRLEDLRDHGWLISSILVDADNQLDISLINADGETSGFISESLKGDKGDPGDTGATGKGITSISKTGTSGLVDTYTITYSDNTTSTFTITNGADGADGQDGAAGADGADGADGQDGADGVSPAVTVSTITGGHTVTITDADHPNGQTFNVMDGADGQDTTVYNLNYFHPSTPEQQMPDSHKTANLAVMEQIRSATPGTYRVTVEGIPALWSIYNNYIYVCYLDAEVIKIGTFLGTTTSNYGEGWELYVNDTGNLDDQSSYPASQYTICAALAAKQDLARKITTGTNITLADNTEYRLSNVTTLTLAYPQGNFECWLRLEFASSGTITVTLPTSRYIGNSPTFSNGDVWELSIKDGIVIAGKAEEVVTT